MITKEFLKPKSIAIVGGSEDIQKPGGKVLKNLLDTNFPGHLYAVNPKADTIQGIPCYRKVEDLPRIDVAILAIPARLCLQAVKVLCAEKSAKGIIIFFCRFFRRK